MDVLYIGVGIYSYITHICLETVLTFEGPVAK